MWCERGVPHTYAVTASRAHRLWRTAAVVVGFAFLLAVWPGGDARPVGKPAPVVHRCEEDEACWSPRLMGNGLGVPAWK